MRFHADHRRAFYGDIFETTPGDINVVYLTPHIPVAWHRHQKQDDHLWLVSGMLRVRVFHDPAEERIEHDMVALPGARRVITISAGDWHGYEALAKNTVILQFNGPGKWDGTDEERHPIGDAPWNW